MIPHDWVRDPEPGTVCVEECPRCGASRFFDDATGRPLWWNEEFDDCDAALTRTVLDG